MTSQTHEQTGESNFFIYDCGTHYSNCHLVILHNKIDSVQS